MKYLSKTYSLIISLTLIMIGCKEKNASKDILIEQNNLVSYAQGFSISHQENYTLLTVNSPWPESEESYTYALVKNTSREKITEAVDAVIEVPLKSIVVTSTTHIPSLEMLNVLESLIGFPNTNYVSSNKARALIDSGKVKEVGKNEALNVEVLIEMQPDAVIGFGVDGENTSLNTVAKTGIPVLYNGDWTEQHPLGKAEWIKFFGLLYDKEALANQLFDDIESSYKEAKLLASKTKTNPTVLSGAMYKDVWYAPRGSSWAAQFIKDAHATYLWEETTGTGSLALPLETALEQGQRADLWIGPGQFSSYKSLEEAHEVYTQFRPFKEREIYSFTLNKGETGGVLYYELAPNRPDIVLRDLVKIIHPEVLPEHELFFFKPLL